MPKSIQKSRQIVPIIGLLGCLGWLAYRLYRSEAQYHHTRQFRIIDRKARRDAR